MKTGNSLLWWESAKQTLSETSRDVLSPFTSSFRVENFRLTIPDHSYLSAIHVAAGLATLAVTGVGLRSAINMIYWRRKLRMEKSGDAPPGPTPLPFLGNVIQLRSNYYKTLHDYIDKPASVFWVLSTPFVIINEEQGLRRVLGGAGGLYTKPKYFGYRSRAVKGAVQKERETVAKESIAYLNDGDTSRIALDNLVHDSLATIKTSMDALLHELEEVSRDHEATASQDDTVSFIRKAIVGLNLEVLFGLTERSKNPEDPSRISEMIGFAGTEFARRMVNPLKVLVDIPGNIRFFRDVGGLIGLGRRLCRVLDDAAQAIGENGVAQSVERVARSTSGLSWVHAWMGKVGKIGKLGKVVGLLMASTQTVPLTAVWMLHLVGNEPEVRQRMRQELEELGISSIDDLSYDHLANMKFGDAIVKETLRLYPPFPLIQREAQDNDVLGGITIPQGTPVYVVPWLIHRNPKYWEDPDTFKPERFLTGSHSHGDGPSDWVYLPFGRGARMCAGSKLAVVELKVLLCHAILSFDWESHSNPEVRDTRFPELGMIPKGITLIVRKNKSR